MKCEREKCRRKARARGLCEKHLLHAASLGRVDVGMVDPVVASRHIQFLLNHEVSFCEMSRASGLAWNTLRAVLDQARPILKETESRVLKIQPSLEQRVAAAAKVPAVGTARRLQGLAAIGYDNRFLAQRLGASEVSVWRWMSQSQRVEVWAAKAVVELFNELQMIPCPSSRSRTRAAKFGWLPPFAWDEEDLDNPDAEPHMGGKSTWIQKYEDYRSTGLSDAEVAAAMGIQLESLKRQLERKAA